MTLRSSLALVAGALERVGESSGHDYRRRDSAGIDSVLGISADEETDASRRPHATFPLPRDRLLQKTRRVICPTKLWRPAVAGPQFSGQTRRVFVSLRLYQPEPYSRRPTPTRKDSDINGERPCARATEGGPAARRDRARIGRAIFGLVPGDYRLARDQPGSGKREQ